MTAFAFRVEGDVQGVYFRASTAALAEALQVRGWVCNVRDGTVQGRVAGDLEAVARFLVGLHTVARRGRVEAVTTREVRKFAGRGFEVRPTCDAPTDDWS